MDSGLIMDKIQEFTSALGLGLRPKSDLIEVRKIENFGKNNRF